MATITEPITNKTWVQVVDQAETLDSDGNRLLTLAFKGETQKVATTMSHLYQDETLSSVYSELTTNFTTIDDAGMNITWSLPLGWTWRLQAAEVRQLEAGEYSLLKTIFYGTDATPITPGQDYINVTEDGATLQWQTYSVSPYRYCNEEKHDDAIVDPSTGEALSSENGNKSVRRHIEMAFTQNAQNSESNPYRWEQPNCTREITEAEKRIMDKVAAGVNPVFHYPVVQHIRIIETNLSSLPNDYGPDVKTGIDIIAPLPGNVAGMLAQALVPWEALSGSFIYCGQTVNYSNRWVKDSSGADQKLFTFQVTDVFEGALKPDVEFYGPAGTRWEFGKGPHPIQAGGH